MIAAPTRVVGRGFANACAWRVLTRRIGKATDRLCMLMLACALLAALPSGLPFGLPVAAIGVAGTTAWAAPPASVDIKHVRAGIAKFGSRRVIVRLTADAVPSGVSASATSVRDQAARIAAVQRTLSASLRAQGVRVLGTLRYSPLLVAEVDKATLESLLLTKGVQAVYEDAEWLPLLAESVPLIHARAADTGGRTGRGQAIAILDTGVDAAHPFLAGAGAGAGAGASRVVRDACFSSAFGSEQTFCPSGTLQQIGAGAARPCASGCEHGTHVAGIAAGAGTSFSGVAPGANLIAIQVFHRNSSGSVVASTSDIIAALEHVYSLSDTLAVASVNLSLGGGRFDSPCDDNPAKAAIDLLRARGIAVAIASGNESLIAEMSAPGCISSAVSVGSTSDTTGAVSGFSNSARFLALLAPGAVIQSAVPGGGFAQLQGTSMATPHVAGAFAVLKEAQPAASVDDMLAALQVTGVQVTDARNGIVTPRIDVGLAVQQLLSSTGTGGFRVTPTGVGQVTGAIGGPFTPSSFDAELTSTADADVPFVISDDADWLDIAPTSGNVPQGGRVVVTARINAQANALPAGDYVASIQANNPATGRGNTTRSIRLSVRPPPAANDKFENAILLEASSGTTLGSSTNASREIGEPLHAGNSGGASLWWRWRATENGTVTFDTLGSSFDTLLASYSGDSITTLSTIASNDDAVGLASRITFPVQAGVVYSIAVDGFSGRRGAITLNWNFSPTIERGGLTVSPDGDARFTGPAGGPFTPSSSAYTLTNTTTADLDVSVDGLPTWLSASASTLRLSPSTSARITLTLNNVASTLGAGTYAQEVTFNGVRRTVVLSVTNAPPANDAFANAQVIARATPVMLPGTNTGATIEDLEPTHAVRGGHSVWWRWTAPVGISQLEVTTDGSNYDTTLAVYTGSDVGSLTSVGSNDDGFGLGVGSRVAFVPQAGITYRFAVDGYLGATGNIQLNLISTGGSGDLPPVLGLVGANPLALPSGAVFQDPGATAVDDRDGEITSRVVASGRVDTQVVGEYLRRYDVSDSAGNAAETLTRVVRVVEPQPFDVDGDGQCMPLTDGVVVLRFMFGFRNDALVSAALAPGATRTDSTLIADRLAYRASLLDIDGVGGAQPLTDGILVARHLFGFTGQSLFQGAVGAGASSELEMLRRLDALCR